MSVMEESPSLSELELRMWFTDSDITSSRSETLVSLLLLRDAAHTSAGLSPLPTTTSSLLTGLHATLCTYTT
jgi:hypothetical protein